MHTFNFFKIQVFNFSTNLATDPTLPGFGRGDFSFKFDDFALDINNVSVGYLDDLWQVSLFDDGSLQLQLPAVSSGVDTTVSTPFLHQNIQLTLYLDV